MRLWRENRQSKLTKAQEKEIISYLGRSKGTELFVDEVNQLLGNFENDWFFFIERNTCLRYREVIDQAKHLTRFLDAEPYKEGEAVEEGEIDFDRWARTILSQDQSYDFDKNEFDRTDEYLIDLNKQLKFIVMRLEKNFGKEIRLHAPKTKPMDTGLKAFGMNLIFLFQRSMRRLPVLSENSNDFEALNIIYQAHGYVAEDALRVIKKAAAEHRANVGLRGKYKVKFEEESNR